MKSYLVKKLKEEKYFNESLYKGLDKFYIDNFPWDSNGYMPITEGILLYTDTCFIVKFISYENKISVKHTKDNDPVYKDSCVEFFFFPNKLKDNRYLNFEINAAGVLLLGIGENREGRKLINVDTKIFNINSSVSINNIENYNDDHWSVEYRIPFDFLEEYYGKLNIKSGQRLKANFYKTGDETEKPHYGCWNRISYPHADFHRPEYFGEIILE